MLTEGGASALRGFARGVLLFAPLGFLNAAEGSPGSGITCLFKKSSGDESL